MLDSGKLTDVATSALLAEARDVVDTSAAPAKVARDLYSAYLEGRFDEERVCEIMTWINAGWTSAATDAFVSSIIDERFADRIHAEVRAVIDLARTFGHEIWVVSASPRPIVEAAAAVVGISRERVLAATPMREGERFAPRVERPIPYGPGKASSLAQKLGDLPLLAAFGDNAFDSEMLLLSERPIAVRPKPRLVARAEHIPNIRLLRAE